MHYRWRRSSSLSYNCCFFLPFSALIGPSVSQHLHYSGSYPNRFTLLFRLKEDTRTRIHFQQSGREWGEMGNQKILIATWSQNCSIWIKYFPDKPKWKRLISNVDSVIQVCTKCVFVRLNQWNVSFQSSNENSTLNSGWPLDKPSPQIRLCTIKNLNQMELKLVKYIFIVLY